jgi:hypothetical protein
VDGELEPGEEFEGDVRFTVTMAPRSVRVFEVVPAVPIQPGEEGLIAKLLTVQKPAGPPTATAYSKAVSLASDGPKSVTLVLESMDANTSTVDVFAETSNDGENWTEVELTRFTSMEHRTIAFESRGAASLRLKFRLTAADRHFPAAAVFGARLRANHAG